MSVPAPEVIRGWRENPAKFAHDNFKFVPDAWQKKGFAALGSLDPKFQRVGFKACAGPGKSAELSIAGWWFLSCMASKGEHPKGAALSVTKENLRDNLWAELAKWRNRSEFLKAAFEWTAERIFAKDHPETWFISARSFSRKANAEEQGRTLSGLHAKYVIYLVDEAGDIPIPVLDAAEQGLSNCTWGKIIMAGNPTSLDGALYDAAVNKAHLWHMIEITGDPDDPDRSPKISLTWAREQIAQHGREDPWVMAYILGKFPPSSINALLGYDEVKDAMRRQLKEDAYEWAQKRLGVDVARFGDDMSVIFKRQGLASFKSVDMRGVDGPTLAGRVAVIKSEWKSENEYVDNTGGYGAGVIDFLRQGGYKPVPVDFSGVPLDPRYYNKRSEIWFKMAEWVKAGGVLYDDPQLIKELTTPTYSFFKGKLRLEEKDQIKARLGFSPDKADALALTFAAVDQPRGILAKLREKLVKTANDWDPFEDQKEKDPYHEGRIPIGPNS